MACMHVFRPVHLVLDNQLVSWFHGETIYPKLSIPYFSVYVFFFNRLEAFLHQ